jgi:hypothetical protein
MIVNFTGFETGDLGECAGSSGTVSVQATVKRTGDYALRVNPVDADVGYANLRKPAANGSNAMLDLATTTVRGYLRVAARPASGAEMILALDGGSGFKGALLLGSDGKLTIWDVGYSAVGQSSTALALDTWYRVELRIGTGTAAAYALRVDGTEWLSGTGSFGASNAYTLRVGKYEDSGGEQGLDVYWDDLLIDDADWPGAGEVRRLDPDGDGTYTDWTGTYQDVDEVPPQDADTSYITTSTSGAAETVTLESCASAGVSGTIRAVKSLAAVRDEGGTSALSVRLRSSSTNDDTTGIDLGTSYVTRGKVYPTDPATAAAWTPSAVDAVEVGVVAGAAVAHRCTLLCAMVATTPAVTARGARWGRCAGVPGMVFSGQRSW